VEPAPVAAPESGATAVDESDLTQLNGVGKVIANKLSDHGITLKQIAAWTEEDVQRVDEELDLKGRIAREDWIAQAKALLG
jgi:large subunit ribosomal protein L21